MPTLSLSMIVKNEEKHLVRCLSSIKDVADEIVIIDTGSTDKTLEIAESFNAKIFHFNWVNDFSTARNYALSKCSCDWVLYLDADEELNPNYIEEVNNYKTHLPAAFYCTIKSPGSAFSNGSLIRYPRLFANVPGIEFSGKVHEQIADSLRKNKIPLIDSKIEIIHYGYLLDNDGMRKKKERNLSLLLSTDSNKASVYDKLKLIHTLISVEKLDEAEIRLINLTKHKQLAVKDLGLALFYIAQIKFEKNDLTSALDFASKSRTKLNNKPELNYLLYLIHLRKENYNEAFKYLINTINLNKKLLVSNLSFESENILDQTDLYLRAINISLRLNNKSNIEKFIAHLADYISNEKQIENFLVLSFLNKLLLSNTQTDFNSDLLKRIINPAHLNSVLEIVKYCKDDLVVISNCNSMLQIFPTSSSIYKSLAQLHINLDQEKSIWLFKKSLEYEKDPVVYISLISIYISKCDYKNVIQCFNELQTNCSGKEQIKGKIDLLKEKLEPILKNPTQYQTD